MPSIGAWASAANLKTSTLSKILSKKYQREPRIEIAAKMAGSMGVSIDRLLAWLYVRHGRTIRQVVPGVNTPIRNLHRFRYKRNRAEVIAGYGGKCAECGTKRNLQIDHVAGDGWRKRGAAGGYRDNTRPLVARLRRAGFPPTHQVLCGSCNSHKNKRQCLFCGKECDCAASREHRRAAKRKR